MTEPSKPEVRYIFPCMVSCESAISGECKSFKQDAATGYCGNYRQRPDAYSKGFEEGYAKRNKEIVEIIEKMSFLLSDDPDNQPHGTKRVIDRDELLRRINEK